ncbi:hypothetical protein J6590_048216 [Homalodisca vitripennis]|nr:hypothetical protein J6590_048216 [Homalodisca vitripennis]
MTECSVPGGEDRDCHYPLGYLAKPSRFGVTRHVRPVSLFQTFLLSELFRWVGSGNEAGAGVESVSRILLRIVRNYCTQTRTEHYSSTTPHGAHRHRPSSRYTDISRLGRSARSAATQLLPVSVYVPLCLFVCVSITRAKRQRETTTALRVH